MRKTTLALIAGAGALLAATTAASAQTFVGSTVYYGDEAPPVTQVREYCDDAGTCSEERFRRYTPAPTYYDYDPSYQSYNYYEPNYTYGRRYYRKPSPGIYVRTPGFSFGFGGW